MTQNGTWVSYAGTAQIVLAGVLAVIAAGVAYAGFRLPRPARFPRPGKPVRMLIYVSYPAAILAFPVCAYLYGLHAYREHLAVTPPADPITPFTLIGMGIVFCVIAMAYSSRGARIALVSAVRGAIAGPMIFELPFDLIVMTRSYPALPPDPALYRLLFFAPLFVIEISTLALLAISPVARLSRPTLWGLAAMLAVFAVWALFGFGYPSAPGPIILNVVSKILALVTSLTVFVPPRTEPGTEALARPATAAAARAWTGVF
jgi:hypothetical protein